MHLRHAGRETSFVETEVKAEGQLLSLYRVIDFKFSNIWLVLTWCRKFDEEMSNVGSNQLDC